VLLLLLLSRQLQCAETWRLQLQTVRHQRDHLPRGLLPLVFGLAGPAGPHPQLLSFLPGVDVVAVFVFLVAFVVLVLVLVFVFVFFGLGRGGM
jgi:hypothetical protein